MSYFVLEHLLAAAIVHNGVELEECVHPLGVLLAVEALEADIAVMDVRLNFSECVFLFVHDAPGTVDSDEKLGIAEQHLDQEKCMAGPLGGVLDRLLLWLGQAEQVLLVFPVLSDLFQRVQGQLVNLDEIVVFEI